MCRCSYCEYLWVEHGPHNNLLDEVLGGLQGLQQNSRQFDAVQAQDNVNQLVQSNCPPFKVQQQILHAAM